MIKYESTYTEGALKRKKKKKSVKHVSNDAYAMFSCARVFSPYFLYKSICCGYSFELH